TSSKTPVLKRKERQLLIRPKELTGPISLIACSAPFGFELMSGGGIRQDRRNDHPIAADAVNGRDPTGDVCERRKGEGFIAWGKRAHRIVVFQWELQAASFRNSPLH